jgi:protocatechuate 3,4-dioxygenase beta subunit
VIRFIHRDSIGADAMKHDDDFGGLARDLETLSRRRMLGFMAKAAAGLSLAPLIAACGDDLAGSTVDAATDGGSDGSSETCARTPSETAGPYPGDGTNGPNALTVSGIERADIRTSIGTASGTAAGIELTVTLTLVSATTCEPLAGYAVYLWHCDRAGDYSMYTGAAQSENYLRGVQGTDAAGKVTFTTIFPGCYSGRWPHIHFEVFNSAITSTRIAVSQLALPKSSCDEVYATTGYEASVTNLAGITLANDNVFRDGSSLQMATVSGSVSGTLASTLTVAVAS